MPIKVEHLNYIYSEGTTFERQALHDICLDIPDGQFIGIIGHTGSGKSTLTQHLNGLLRASSGTISLDGRNIYEEGFPMKQLRSQVGLVFQYPEHQLFDVNVLTDVQFGPKNLGLSMEEVMERAVDALKLVGLDRSLYEKSPFELSGGQKRRAAIAGILAMQPRFLILDEPTAGLDPRGRDEILDMVRDLQQQRHITVILVSHSMEDVAKYVERIIVMNQGRIFLDDTPQAVFRHAGELEQIGLDIPSSMHLTRLLRKRGWDLSEDAATPDEAASMILDALGKTAAPKSGTAGDSEQLT